MAILFCYYVLHFLISNVVESESFQDRLLRQSHTVCWNTLTFLHFPFSDPMLACDLRRRGLERYPLWSPEPDWGGGGAHLHLITLACAGPYKTGGRRPSLKTDAQFMLRKEGRRWRGSMLDQWQLFPWDRPRHTKAISYICCPLRFNRERTVSIVFLYFFWSGIIAL